MPVAKVTVEHEARPDALLLRVRGSLTLEQVAACRKELNRAWRGAVSPVVLDLSGLARLDTAGAALLVLAYRRAAEQGRVFHLTGLNPQAERVLRLLRLDRPLTSPTCSPAPGLPARLPLPEELQPVLVPSE
ncbi:MAG: STAS domain-containing protein [Terriglobia bacterium]